MQNWGCILLIVSLLVAAGCARAPEQPVPDISLEQPQPGDALQSTNLTPEQKQLAELLSTNGYNGNGSKPTVIVVHKLSRKLTLYQGLTPLKTYPVVLGRDSYNDKLCQGDTCTPEGVYHVLAKYPHSRWDYFIYLDYPNNRNWLKFARAKKEGHLPPDADIGGEVGIHGTEDSSKNLCGINWTRGCVSLQNQDLEEIYPLVNDKTLVVIQKQ